MQHVTLLKEQSDLVAYLKSDLNVAKSKVIDAITQDVFNPRSADPDRH